MSNVTINAAFNALRVAYEEADAHLEAAVKVAKDVHDAEYSAAEVAYREAMRNVPPICDDDEEGVGVEPIRFNDFGDAIAAALANKSLLDELDYFG